MTALLTGGQDQTGKNMAEAISRYKQRRAIRQELTYPISKDELWELISRPGNLNECHPLCRTNEALEWQDDNHSDRLVYLNGRTYVRQFINWNIGNAICWQICNFFHLFLFYFLNFFKLSFSISSIFYKIDTF